MSIEYDNKEECFRIEDSNRSDMYNNIVGKDMIAEDLRTIPSRLSGNAMKAVVYEEIKMPNGEKLFERVGWNNTLIGGTQLNACSIWGFDKTRPGYVKIHTFDEESGVVLGSSTPTAKGAEVFGCLFSLDGCTLGTEAVVDRSGKGFDIAGVVPMRMLAVDEDVPTLMEKYELRSVYDGYVKYFIKRPTSITLMNMTVDGNPLSDYPDVSLTDTVDVVTAVEMIVELGVDDMREYFAIVEGDVSSRRFSGISIVRGDQVTCNVGGVDYIEHRNIVTTQRVNGKDRNLEKYNTGKYIIMVYYM